jgi:hypothetical protein
VYAYEEDWESIDNSDDFIDLSPNHGEIALSDTDDAKYDYSKFERVIYLTEGSDVHTCVSACRPFRPVHCNNRELNLADFTVYDPILMLDFYNQDPSQCRRDCMYISVVGNALAEQCSRVDWGFCNDVKQVNIEGSDIATFFETANVSLENIHIMSSESLMSYISR